VSKKPKFPKQISIAGQDIKIKYQKDIKADGTLGLNKLLMNEISVRTHYDGEKLPHDQVLQTLTHEIIHGCLVTMGTELALQCNLDEGFVDGLAHLIWQARKTEKY